MFLDLLIMFAVALVAAWAFVWAHYKVDFIAQMSGR